MNLNLQSFTTRTYGKWILTGEHAVLRGEAALVFPLRSKFLQLDYKTGSHGLTVDMEGQFGPEFRVLFWSLLEKASALTQLPLVDLKGQVSLSSQIPVGGGLGASAAVCAAVARWFAFEKEISEDSVFKIARELENIFHGESSGVDVAVSLSEKPLRFQKSRWEILNPTWTPRWGLTDTGQKGMTYDCVKKVKELFGENADLAQKLDRDMGIATEICQSALRSSDNYLELAKGVQLAGNCFRSWQLVSTSADKIMNEFLQAGALAAKPTGSGGGGYILSLWQQPWPSSLDSKIIAV